LANVTGRSVVSAGGDTWFFITADYAFGYDLETQTSKVVRAAGGNTLGSLRVPLNTADFFFLLAPSAIIKGQNNRAC
jgi:branched-chain amino acid transport system substrate-binding protein